MTRANFSQKSFLGGEWSPFAQGRSETEEYRTALKECTNYVPLEEGALTRRPGFFEVAVARSATNNIQLERFVVTNASQFILEFTDVRMRVYKDGLLLLEDEQTVVSFSGANPAEVEVTGHNYSNGDWVKFTPNNNGGAPVRNRFFEIKNKDTNTFELDKTLPFSGEFDGADMTDWAGGTVQRVLEVTIPWGNSDIPDLQFTQDENGLYVFHGDYEVRKIRRGVTDLLWTVTQQDFLDGPYLDAVNNGVTFTPSGTSGSITVTASATTGINDGLGFQTTDIGRWMRMPGDDGNWVRGTITARASSTVVTVNLSNNSSWTLPNTNAIEGWRLGVYSDTDGWPKSGAFHEGRLMLTGVRLNRIDGSKNFRPTRFDPTSQDGTVADDNGVSYILDSDDLQHIFWILSDPSGSLCGTLGGEWLVRASAVDEPLAPTNIQARRITKFGCANVVPVKASKATLFVQANKRRIIEYARPNDADRSGELDGVNLSRFAKHLSEGGIEEIVYQKDPYPIVWGRRGDGTLVAFSYKRGPDQEFTAWHSHPFDTSCDGSTTAPLVKSLAVGVTADKLSEELWIAVRRRVNKVNILTIERQDQVNDLTETARELEYFVGDGIQYSEADFAALWDWTSTIDYGLTFYGLWHLEGECVDVAFRGADLGEKTVTDGQVTFNIPEELAAVADDATYGDQFTIVRDVNVTFTWSSNFLHFSVATDIPGASLFQVNSSRSGNKQFVEGADGNLYHLISGHIGGKTISIVNVATGVVSDSITNTLVNTITAANGLNPINGVTYDFGSSSSMHHWSVPGTKYFWVKTGDNVTPPGDAHAAHVFILCEIDISGLIVAKGAFVERSSAGDVNHVTVVHGFGILGTDPLADDGMLVYSKSGAGNDESWVLKLPSVNDQIDSWTASTTIDGIFLIRATEFTSDVGNDFLIPTLGTYRASLSQRAFVLPTNDGGLVCFYIGHAETQAHIDNVGTQNSYIDGLVGTYPDGFMAALEVTRTSSAANGYSLGTIAVVNDQFKDTDASTIIPFDDVGLDRDGTAGDQVDDYICPSVVNNGDNNIRILFPRIYSLTDTSLYPNGSYAKVVIFQWDISNQIATKTAEDEGAWFHTVNDTGGSLHTSVPHALIPTFSSTGNKLYLAGLFDGVSSSIGEKWVVGEIGVYNPERTVSLDTGVTVAIGLGYKSRAQLLRPDAEISRTGVGLGKIRRVDQAGILLFRTGPFKVGTNYTDNILLRLDDPLASGVQPLYSGVYQTSIEGTTDFDGEVTFEMDRPFPMTLLAITGFVDTSER